MSDCISIVPKPRLVCWYSNGAASIIASKKAIEMQPKLYPNHEIVVARIYIKEEFHEPERDEIVEKFLGHKILNLSDVKHHASVDEVIRVHRYMSGVRGAKCTKVLKKAVRIAWQRDNDVHVFGFDCDEGERRINNLLDTEPEIEYFAPLMDLKMSKKDCFHEMNKAGIPLPKMYQLGYHNNNCIGCVKAGGAGYWNKIRKDFPDVFQTRARQEYLLNIALVSMSRDKFIRDYPEHFEKMCNEWEDRYKIARSKSKKGVVERKISLIPLRFLPDSAGSHKDLDIGDCGFICEIDKNKVA